jgi:hypothetical protein
VNHHTMQRAGGEHSPSTVPGRSIRLFLADGTPQGLIIAEIMNWTGQALVTPRSGVAGLLRRAEAARTGTCAWRRRSSSSVW